MPVRRDINAEKYVSRQSSRESSRTRNGISDKTSFVTVPDFVGSAEIAYNDVVLEPCTVERVETVVRHSVGYALNR